MQDLVESQQNVSFGTRTVSQIEPLLDQRFNKANSKQKSSNMQPSDLGSMNLEDRLNDLIQKDFLTVP